jgi:hypothetical protein
MILSFLRIVGSAGEPGIPALKNVELLIGGWWLGRLHYTNAYFMRLGNIALQSIS